MKKKPLSPFAKKSTTKIVLLDTNIISKLSSEKLGEMIYGYLNGFLKVNPDWSFAISDFTYFELLNGLSSDKENEVTAFLDSSFPFYAVDREILRKAAHLGSLYKEHFAELGFSDGMPEHGDKIIAATAFKHSTLIFTTNIRDFPQPFFKEIARKLFEYDVRNRMVCVPTYFVEPQIELTQKYHSHRFSKVQKPPK